MRWGVGSGRIDELCFCCEGSVGVIRGLMELVGRLPVEGVGFEGTQFGFPVSEVLFGGPPEVARLREEAEALNAGEAQPQEAAWVALAAAEVLESAAEDRDRWFIRDGGFRGMVFTGIKWRAGWILLLGEGQEEYARAFGESHFMVFTTRPGIETGRFLGERETASVYFAQLLARYALLYSDVKAGERHELTHFVEDHGPGVVVMTGEMGEVEALLCLALMRLGLKAVVTSGFPWEVGDRVEVSGPAEAVEAAGQFDNMRMRSQADPLAALPAYANPAYEHEEFEVSRRLGGSEGSFFLLRRGAAAEGVEVTGEPVGEPEGDVGVVVTVDDDTLDGPAAEELERAAAGYLNLLRGVKVEERRPLRLGLSAEAAVTGEQMGEVVRRGLRLEYPRLGPVGVMVIGEAGRLAEMRREAEAEWKAREEEIGALGEVAMESIFACESCAPFSREHVCLTHPLRTPMCGRRWTEILAGARYMSVSAGRPWRRRGRPENCCAVVPLGRAIDPVKGEYEGLNEFVRRATGGRMQRVFLHSVREYPHSSCGCFYALAWWSDELGGIGVMQRGFEGAAPEGSTWNALANRAGGKQQPGITGVATRYMESPTFLQGDGGWRAVKWMTRKLKEELREAVPEVESIPTEED